MLLADWARKARLGLKLTTKSSTASSPSARQSAFGLQDLVEFRYDLAVGDHVLSPDELAELAALKVPLVRVRGQWVELDDRHLKAALKFLERNRSGTMTAADVLQADAHGPADGVPVTGWTPTAGSATCCPDRPTGGCRRWPHRTASTASCGRTSSAASPGCLSSANSASAPSSPTTWAWARPFSCWR